MLSLYSRRVTPEVKCYVKDNASGKCKRKSHSNTTESGFGVFPKTKNTNGPSFDEDERFNPSKPFHPGPLKLDIKSIKNSTRADSTGIAINSLENEENGRSLLAAGIIFLWIWIWKWKATITFFIVHSLDFLWVSFKNLLGWGNEHYETTITLGNEHPPRRRRIFNYQPDHGWPGQAHGHGHQGHNGWEPERWVHKTKNAWHHPATNLFQQPTYQYLPYGGEYTLLGYDQHQAQK